VPAFPEWRIDLRAPHSGGAAEKHLADAAL
jgi:hypothetical protein